jgi:hypothetical protein
MEFVTNVAITSYGAGDYCFCADTRSRLDVSRAASKITQYTLGLMLG